MYLFPRKYFTQVKCVLNMLAKYEKAYIPGTNVVDKGRLAALVESDGHSGASFSWTYRQCMMIYKNSNPDEDLAKWMCQFMNEAYNDERQVNIVEKVERKN